MRHFMDYGLAWEGALRAEALVLSCATLPRWTDCNLAENIRMATWLGEQIAADDGSTLRRPRPWAGLFPLRTWRCRHRELMRR